jgi:hypothetical protein
LISRPVLAWRPGSELSQQPGSLAPVAATLAPVAPVVAAVFAPVAPVVAAVKPPLAAPEQAGSVSSISEQGHV